METSTKSVSSVGSTISTSKSIGRGAPFRFVPRFPFTHSSRLSRSKSSHLLSYNSTELGVLTARSERGDIAHLFQGVGISCQVVLCQTRKLPTYAFVDIDTDHVSHALSSIDGTRLSGRSVRCIVATSRAKASTGLDQRSNSSQSLTASPHPPTFSLVERDPTPSKSSEFSHASSSTRPKSSSLPSPSAPYEPSLRLSRHKYTPLIQPSARRSQLSLSTRSSIERESDPSVSSSRSVCYDRFHN